MEESEYKGNNINLEIKDSIICKYDLDSDKQINFLLDYTKYLTNAKKYDAHIISWQKQNQDLLRNNGIDMNTINSVY